jgi:alpha-amylase/alpha-mannosidase (GH57 family)
LKELAAKGERFTEDEKQEILAEQRKIIAQVIPSLRKHMESGQIDISVSPYFHPILPLLCDTSSALEAMPDAVLPQRRFRHPEDAARQIEDAVALYLTLFGRQPQGMWPSEGSVSQDIIPIIQKYGFKWIASDEEILAQSIGVQARGSGTSSLLSSGALYNGYEYESQTARMAIFFRDHALSDDIGFVYFSWSPDKAADDFVSKLATVARSVREKRIDDPIISIILDGENAWEYYKNDGHDFLAALYAKIEETPWLKTVTFSDYLAGKPKLGKLKKLFAGSWINHNFAVWIGHEEDNKAWDLLGRARDELEAFVRANPLFDKEQLKLAWKEIMIAEGSDWCWWFGEDHLGPYNDDFDRLFRMHLANAYMLTGREPPMELYEPIRSTYSSAYLQKPVDYIKPVIDGKLTHFYEWQQAGFFDCSRAGTTMHKAEHIISGIWFGFDNHNLYFRLDHGTSTSATKFAELAIELEFHDTTRQTLRIEPGKKIALLNNQRNEAVNLALDEFLEISLPIELLKAGSSAVSVRITVLDGDRRLETWPLTEAIRIELPGSAEIPWAV